MAAVGRESPLKGLNADDGSEVEFKGKVGPKTEKKSEPSVAAVFI